MLIEVYIKNITNGSNGANNSTWTFMKANNPVNKIVPDNPSCPKNKFNWEVMEINEKLAETDWAPNLYKNPTERTFIIIPIPRLSLENHIRKLLQLH